MGAPVQMWAEDLGDGEQRAPLEPCDAAEDGAELHKVGRGEWDERFAEMAERQARFMFRVAHGLLRNVQDAEDAVQEALLKLYRGDGWRAMEDEKAFLARTVWRVGLDVVARRPKATEPLEND